MAKRKLKLNRVKYEVDVKGSIKWNDLTPEQQMIVDYLHKVITVEEEALERGKEDTLYYFLLFRLKDYVWANQDLSNIYYMLKDIIEDDTRAAKSILKIISRWETLQLVTNNSVCFKKIIL